MRHSTSSRFRRLRDGLLEHVQVSAKKSFELLRADQRHTSLQFKRIGGHHWSARVGLQYRAVAREVDDGFLWVWIGTHGEYDRLLIQLPESG